MRDYGKVHSSFWSSATIRGMSEDARTLALYLLTSPHSTIVGTFRLPDGYASEDLRWTPKRVAEGFRELSGKGFAKRCETTKWVWVVKHLDWNPPENPNQRKSAGKVVLSIPDECAWKRDFLRDCGHLVGLEGIQDGEPSETVPEPFLNQEQEQEQEQEKVTPPLRGSPRRTAASRIPDDWGLTEADMQFAASKGFDRAQAEEVANAFRDYWTAKPGAAGSKCDWAAAWRTWCRTEAERRASRPPVAGSAGRNGGYAAALRTAVARVRGEDPVSH